MLPRYDELNYYVVFNKTTGRYVMDHPGIYGYKDISVPSIKISVGTELEDATKHYNQWVESIGYMIERIEGYNAEYQNEEHIEQLQAVDLILVHIKEKREFQRSEIIT